MGLFGKNSGDQGPEPNPLVRSSIMLVASAYIIYLGAKLLIDTAKGTPGMPKAASIGFGILFIIFGAVAGVINIKRLREQKKADEAKAAENAAELARIEREEEEKASADALLAEKEDAREGEQEAGGTDGDAADSSK
jgi:flagellar biosynthesis component FlhA